jgi:ParB-like chromosome segregation protein Spo0J
MAEFHDVRVDEQFRERLQPLSERERRELKESIKRDGFRDPLIAWLTESGELILVDGHTRWHIYHELIAEGFSIEVPAVAARRFDSREGVLDFIERNQLARRNLSREAQDLLYGAIVEREQRRIGQRGPQKLAHNEPTSTAGRLAPALNTNPARLKRAAKFKKNVDEISESVPDARREIASGGTGLSRADVSDIAKMPPAQRSTAYAEAKGTAAERKKRSRTLGHRSRPTFFSAEKLVRTVTAAIATLPDEELAGIAKMIGELHDELLKQLAHREGASLPPPQEDPMAGEPPQQIDAPETSSS